MFIRWLLLLMAALPLCAELTRIEVTERTPVAGGYERIAGKAYFSLNPERKENAEINDLKLAPRTPAGRVEFSADIYILQPADIGRANGTVLFEVVNRGNRLMVSRFMYGKSGAEEFGDLWLFKQGYTLAWLGWQGDVPKLPGRLRMDAPVVPGVRGLVRAEFIPSTRTTRMGLADRDHIPYTAVDAPAKLTVRDSILGRRRTIPAAQWRFTPDRAAVEMPTGFAPGQIYELVYTAENPRVEGVSMAGIRDLISNWKSSAAVTPLHRAQRALAFGISQSGRYLRTFLYYGMNEDERGLKVFDGVWADVAGAGRGFFNQRFAQPSRSTFAYWHAFYPTDLYPFSDVPQPRPGVEGARPEGLLDRLTAKTMPKIVYTNGSWEYWNRCAALVHVSVMGGADAPLGPQTRLYVFAGEQHLSGWLPKRDKEFSYTVSPVNTQPYYRAILTALHEWVKDNREPPRSEYPTLADEQLTSVGQVRWPKTAGVPLPKHPNAAYELDFGPKFEIEGVSTKEPPVWKGTYPVLVPQVDADGLDLGGIRLPEVAAPLGIATGWNLRATETGAAGEIGGMVGSFFAFSKEQILQRYKDKDGYLEKVRSAADALVKRRFLLVEDRARVMTHAAELWDAVMAGTAR